MWEPKYTDFRHKDFFTPRSSKEVYGVYLSFDDPLPWYRREKPVVAAVCISLIVLVFGIYKGVIS